jgi:hypothetical protein
MSITITQFASIMSIVFILNIVTYYPIYSSNGTTTSKNQPKCNHSIYDYMRLVVVCD